MTTATLIDHTNLRGNQNCRILKLLERKLRLRGDIACNGASVGFDQFRITFAWSQPDGHDYMISTQWGQFDVFIGQNGYGTILESE